MTIPKLRLLLRDARVKPACNEMEFAPAFPAGGDVQVRVDNGIVPIGFAPIGSPTRPTGTARDGHGGHPGPVLVGSRSGWSSSGYRLREMGGAAGPGPYSFLDLPQRVPEQPEVGGLEPHLRRGDEAVAGIDRNSRLIKGPGLPLKEGQTWEDLWDLDGTIAQ